MTFNCKKNIPHAAAAARNLDAAIPLRSAQTETHNTIELQHTTVEHIALMRQFQRSVSTHAKHNSTASTKQEKVTWSPQFHGACSSSNIPRRFLRPSRVQANFFPQWNLIRLPEKKAMQIL